MPQPPPPERTIKIVSYAIGALLALSALAVLVLPQFERVYPKGPPNTGHQTLACTDCHTEAAGTVRQQLQAKLQYWVGNRATDASFGHETVGNAQCTACHLRDVDNHPVHRFLEPRFAGARAALGAHLCVSCHREHKGVRVTMIPIACSNCHQDLDIKNEPIVDISHKQLVKRQAWSTCLGCHDFHGNHRRAAQVQFKEAYSESTIMEYLAGGPSPYGRDIKFLAKKGAR